MICSYWIEEGMDGIISVEVVGIIVHILESQYFRIIIIRYTCTFSIFRIPPLSSFSPTHCRNINAIQNSLYIMYIQHPEEEG